MRIPFKEVLRLKRRASYEGYVGTLCLNYFLILLLKGTVRPDSHILVRKFKCLYYSRIPFKQYHFQSIFLPNQCCGTGTGTVRTATFYGGGNGTGTRTINNYGSGTGTGTRYKIMYLFSFI
jgi:hypothetical protein